MSDEEFSQIVQRTLERQIEQQKKIEALEKRVAELEVKMNMVLPEL